MAQDQAQNFFIWGIVVISLAFIFLWYLGRRCDYCKNDCRKCKEDFSPFRRTGGCPPRTGWTYLDEYEQEQYYKQYPYIYPTPTSYTRRWYANRRAENQFLEQQKKFTYDQFRSLPT